MNRIDRALEKLKCRTCGNLSYWDGFFCKKGLHHTKGDKLSRRPIKNCDEYLVRVGHNYEECKEQERCVFFCNDCELYKSR